MLMDIHEVAYHCKMQVALKVGLSWRFGIASQKGGKFGHGFFESQPLRAFYMLIARHSVSEGKQHLK
jgi:hypothetical protein